MATKLGAIYVEVRSDDTQWKKDMKMLRSEATKQGKGVSEALNSSISPKQASAGIKQISTNLKQLGASAKVPGKQFEQVAQAMASDMRDVAKHIGLTEKEFANLNERMLRNRAAQTAERSLKSIANAAGLSNKEIRDMAVQMGYSSKEAQGMADKIQKAETSVQRLDKSMDKAERVTKKTAGTFDAFGGVLKTVRAAALGYATVLATMQISEFTSGIISQGAEIDALNRTYANMTGSTAAANKEMHYIRQTAQDLGLNLNALESSYKNIYAASVNTTLEGQGVRDIFSAISKAGAVLGMSADDTTGSLRALSQMISKGNVQAEELRGQLGERLPGAFQMAAEAMGVTTSQLDKMLEQGQVAASDLLPRLAVVLERRFGDSAEDAGDRARASFERFSNAIVTIQRAIADSGILNFFADLASSSAAVLDMLSEGIRGPSLEKQLATIKGRIEEIEDAERISGEKRDARYQAYLENERKTKAAAMETAEAIQGAHEAAQQGAKTEAEMLEELKGQYNLLLSDIMSFEIGDRTLAFRNGLIETREALQALPPWLEMINTLSEKGALTDTDVGQRTQAYEAMTEEIYKLTLSQFENEKRLLDKQKVDLEAHGFDKEKIEKFYQANLTKLRKEETERQKKEYEDQVKAAQAAADEKLEIQQQLDLDMIGNLDAVNYTEKERRMQISKDLFNQTKDILKDKADAEEKARKEAEKAEEKARSEYEREWKRVYDDMHKFAADTFYDIFDGQLDSFEDFADSMLDIFKRMLANMAAEAAMTNIFKPLMQQMAGSALGNFFGLPGSGGGGIPGLSNIGRLFGLGGPAGSGVSAFGGIGAVGGAYQGPGMGAAISSPGIGQMFSSAMTAAIPAAVMAGGAMIISKVASGWGERSPRAHFYGGDAPNPTFVTGSERGENVTTTTVNYEKLASEIFDYRIAVEHAGDNAGLRRQFVDYFDTVFTGVETILPNAMSDALEKHSTFFGSVSGDKGGSGVSLQNLSSQFFSEVIGDLVQQLVPGSSAFDTGFFGQIVPEGGTQWDAFIQFGAVVQNTENFMEKFTRQMNEFGESSVSAYQNMMAINNIMTAIGADIDAIVTLSTFTAELDTINTMFDDMVAVLQSANATVSELNEAERGRNILLGTQITGVTAGSLQSAIAGGGSISSILKQSLTQSLAGVVAEEIAQEYLIPLNERVGEVWQETGGDIEAVLAAIQGYDLSGAEQGITDFKDRIDGLFGSDQMGGYSTPDWMGNFVSALSLLGSDSTATRVRRNDILRGMDESLRPLQEFVWALEDGAQKIESATSGLDTVRGTIAGILGGSQTPQSREFFERRYESLLSDAQRNPENVSAFTDFATQYLDFISDYGDPKGQERVLKDLFGLEGSLEDRTMSDEITGGKTLYDLYMLIDGMAGQGTFWEQTSPVASYSGGGSISGPTSGYTVPVTFHGKEHISTDSDMKDVKSLLQALVSQNGNGTVKVYVKVGDSGEFREVVADVMRSDPETQEITRRVVNG